MPSGIHVLYVDDDPDVRSVTATALERLGEQLHVTTASRASDALARIPGDDVDCIVSGYDMPGMDGIEFLETVRERDPTIPFILCTAAGSEAVASAAISAGVTDYVRKGGGTDTYDDLVDRVRTAVASSPPARTGEGRPPDIERYATLVQLAPIKLFAIDENARILWLNDEYAEAFAEPRSELLGMEFPTLVERGYYREEAISAYLESVRTLLSSSNDRERGKYEVEFRSATGDRHVYDVHIRLLPLEDGMFAGTVHALRDVTERNRYRRELERQNERLEEFASVVSHDLRNPLNVAQGQLELHTEACSRETDAIETVRWSLDRMDTLIEGLLTLARHGRSVGETGPVDLQRVVSDAWNAVDTGDATLACTLDATIDADGERLRALFENLFRNSVEHGSTGSRPAVDDSVEHGSTGSRPAVDDSVEHGSTGSRPSADDSVEHGSTNADAPPREGTGSLAVTVGRLEGAEPDASTTGFYVADDGTGLENPTPELFEFGYTTDDDGTGLGLAIVDEIARAHGWTVTATTGDRDGARFEFRGVTVLADDSYGLL